MLRYSCILFFLFFLLSVKKTFASTDSDVDVILNRHKEFLLKQGSDGENNVPEIVASFDLQKKRWNTIDYGDNQRAAWRVSDHLRNTKELAVHWSDPKSQWYKNQKIFQIIINALDNWAQHKYKNPNWWHNEIGVPQLMRDILVLIRSDLSSAQINNYLPILKQHRIASDGANLIWSADLGLFYGLFTKDEVLINKAVQHITNEIKFSEKDGLKPDFSFHQHGPRLQMYQYGAAFLLDNIQIAWEVRNTPWSYPQDKVELLTSMLLEGWQWMARGIYTVPETMDRSSTRVNELRAADVRLYVDFFKDLVPTRSAELNALELRQNEKSRSLQGFRHFPYSDFTAYHNDDFSFFLKTISLRTLVSESINNENLKGKLLNSGETYFMQDGKEYFNLMPVWDWEKLPGITAFKGAERVNRKGFNGSVSDGRAGLISMDFMLESRGRDSSISCKKSWFVYDNYVLCLMSDIHLTNLREAYTILDQSRQRGAITTNRGLFAKNVKYPDGLKWVRHNGFIYFPLGGSMGLDLFADTLSGSWYDINRGYSSEKIVERVFMPSISHQPGVHSAAYVVAFSGKRSTKKVISKQPFSIIRNDADCQAVIFSDKRMGVSVYKPGTVVLKNKTIHADKPCLLIVGKKQIYISDPLHEGGIINISYNKKEYQVNLPSDGTVVSFKI